MTENSRQHGTRKQRRQRYSIEKGRRKAGKNKKRSQANDRTKKRKLLISWRRVVCVRARSCVYVLAREDVRVRARVRISSSKAREEMSCVTNRFRSSSRFYEFRFLLKVQPGGGCAVSFFFSLDDAAVSFPSQHLL